MDAESFGVLTTSGVRRDVNSKESTRNSRIFPFEHTVFNEKFSELTGIPQNGSLTISFEYSR